MRSAAHSARIRYTRSQSLKPRSSQLINESTARLAYRDRGDSAKRCSRAGAPLALRFPRHPKNFIIKSVHDGCRLYTAEGEASRPVSYGRLASAVMTWKRTEDTVQLVYSMSE